MMVSRASNNGALVHLLTSKIQSLSIKSQCKLRTRHPDADSTSNTASRDNNVISLSSRYRFIANAFRLSPLFSQAFLLIGFVLLVVTVKEGPL